jgi:hypothetical protein
VVEEKHRYNSSVIWLGLFAVWMAWIFWRKSAWAEGRTRFAPITRGKRVAMSIAASILGPALLLIGLVILDSVGMFEGQMSVPALCAVAVLGIVFIELQMVAVAITGSLVADTVTANRRPSSKIAETEDEK